MSRKIIYADNAATTQISSVALDSMMRFLSTDYANASQPYSFSRPARKALKDARSIIADCIGAKPDEIFFTSCGTESDNWVIHNAGNREKSIVTTQIEHHAILNSCKFYEDKGVEISYLPACDNGLINPTVIKDCLRPQCLLSIMMANNEIGTIEPIMQYNLLAKETKAIMHTDAVQAIGHIKINVHELGVDFLSASGHKFNSPKGIGFLYAKHGDSLSSFIHGGAQETGLRAGTENVASIIAMATALRENIENLDKNQAHLYNLQSIIIDKLDHCRINYKRNGVNQLPGLLSLSFPGFSGESLLHRLDLQGICISTGSACDSKNTQISHVLKAIGLSHDYAEGTIRISLGKYNTEEEAVTIADSLINIVKHNKK